MQRDPSLDADVEKTEEQESEGDVIGERNGIEEAKARDLAHGGAGDLGGLPGLPHEIPQTRNSPGGA